MTAQADDDRDAACARRLKAAGFPPGQARELAAQIREEVRALGPPSPELLEEFTSCSACPARSPAMTRPDRPPGRDAEGGPPGRECGDGPHVTTSRLSETPASARPRSRL